MENFTTLSMTGHFSTLGFFLDCTDRKPRVLGTDYSLTFDQRRALSQINDYYGDICNVSTNVNHCNNIYNNNELDLFLYCTLPDTEVEEVVQAWYVNLQGGQRAKVDIGVTRDDDFSSFTEWEQLHRDALLCDLTTRDGMKSFASTMCISLDDLNVDETPLYQLYDELLQRFQLNHYWRGSPMNGNVLLYVSFYAMLCSTTDIVNHEKCSSGSLCKEDFERQGLLHNNNMKKEVLEGYNDMLSTGRMTNEFVTINWHIPPSDMAMNDAIECCRSHSISNLDNLLCIKTTSVEEMERFLNELFVWMFMNQDEHRLLDSSSDDALEVWKPDGMPAFFDPQNALNEHWERFTWHPSFCEMTIFALAISHQCQIYPPFFITPDNTIKNEALAPNRRNKMDPPMFNRFLILPVIVKIVNEYWFDCKWSENRAEWKRIVEFLLHYYCATTTAMYHRRNGPPSSNLYEVYHTNINKRENCAMAASLAFMHMVDASLALHCENELLQALTLGEMGSSRRDRHYYFTSIGRAFLQLEILVWEVSKLLHENAITVGNRKKHRGLRTIIQLSIRFHLMRDLIKFIKTFSLDPQVDENKDHKKHQELKYIIDCLGAHKKNFNDTRKGTITNFFKAARARIPGGDSRDFKILYGMDMISFTNSTQSSVALDFFLLYYVGYVLEQVYANSSCILGECLFESPEPSNKRDTYAFGETKESTMLRSLEGWEDWAINPRCVVSMVDFGMTIFRPIYFPPEANSNNIRTPNINFFRKDERAKEKAKQKELEHQQQLDAASRPVRQQDNVVLTATKRLYEEAEDNATARSQLALSLLPAKRLYENVTARSQLAPPLLPAKLLRPRTIRYKNIDPEYPFDVEITQGDITEFTHLPNPDHCAIVNAANKICLGGGGVDGVISRAGGPNLLADRKRLPEIDEGGIRCETGSAVITGPNDDYGRLKVKYVIHAVGPQYADDEHENDVSLRDTFLYAAYDDSLACGKTHNLEAIAFSLLSAGIFRGSRTLKHVLKIGLQSICQYEGYKQLKRVIIYGYTETEYDTLVELADEITGLSKVVDDDDHDDTRVQDAMSEPPQRQRNDKILQTTAETTEAWDGWEDMAMDDLSEVSFEDLISRIDANEFDAHGGKARSTQQQSKSTSLAMYVEPDDTSTQPTEHLDVTIRMETNANDQSLNAGTNNNDLLGHGADDLNTQQIIKQLLESILYLNRSDSMKNGTGNMVDRMIIIKLKSLIGQLHDIVIGSDENDNEREDKERGKDTASAQSPLRCITTNNNDGGEDMFICTGGANCKCHLKDPRTLEQHDDGVEEENDEGGMTQQQSKMKQRAQQEQRRPQEQELFTGGGEDYSVDSDGHMDVEIEEGDELLVVLKSLGKRKNETDCADQEKRKKIDGAETLLSFHKNKTA